MFNLFKLNFRLAAVQWNKILVFLSKLWNVISWLNTKESTFKVKSFYIDREE